MQASETPTTSSAGQNEAALAQAIRRHEERLARDPGSLAFAQLADLYRKAGRTQDAAALCRTGLSRYPHYTTARLILAKTLAADNDLDGALTELSAILEVSPKDVQCHRFAAEIQRRRGRIDEALAHLETAVQLDAGDRESRALIGLLRAATPSSADSSALARLLGDDTFTTVSFARLCLDQACLDEAGQVFTRILRKDPENRDAREGLELTLRARQRRKG